MPPEETEQTQVIQVFEAGIKEVVESFYLNAGIHSNPESRRRAFEDTLKCWQSKLKSWE